MVKIRMIKSMPDFPKGEIGEMRNKEHAKMWVDEGYAEYVDKPKLKQNNKNPLVNPKTDNIDALTQIIDRQKELEGDNYLEVFAGDDKKTDKNIKQKRFNVNTANIIEIKEIMKEYNQSSYGVFFNYNPADKPQRLKANIKKILYVFIDLDDANEYHNEIIKETLKEYKITYSYNAKSGHGYHFLIPVNLETDKELNIKAFLNYLRENVCNKVDVSTHTNERLFRVPGSMHHKDEESKQLITIHSHMPTNKEIESNNKLIFVYQLEQKKGKKDVAYSNSIKKEDYFFSTLLNDKACWSKYHKLLDKSKDRNDNFIKNLGFFISSATAFIPDAELFLNNWEPMRVAAMHGWAKKSAEHNTPVLYHELLTWSKNNKLIDFINMLKYQTRETFLDNYEIYYLEDEGKEKAFLLYYPEKNYFVQKSLYEVLQTIYYDCKETGVDLVNEFNLENMEDWDEFPFKKKLATIYSCLHQRLESEKRIKMVYNINYEPSDNKFIILDNKKFFNTYNKSSFWDYNKKQDVYGFPHIKELLMNLCGNEEESYDYFNKWLGHIIQNPLEKLPTAIIFQGKQGSGKGQFKSIILDNIFAHNCQEINQTHLESSFNEYLMGKQIIVANEVMHNENRQTLPNVLKNLVTDDTLTISRKFRKEIVGKNYTHWIFCTNNDNPIKIDEDDRRYSVFYSEKLKGGGKPAAQFIQSLRKNIEFELKEYISYLKSLNIQYFDVHEPIMTSAKEEIIELNRDNVSKFVDFTKQHESYFELNIKLFGTDHNMMLEHGGDGNNYIASESLYLSYISWCEKFKEKGIFNKQNFGKKISSLGLKTQNKRLGANNSQKRVYDLEMIESILIKGAA